MSSALGKSGCPADACRPDLPARVGHGPDFATLGQNQFGQDWSVPGGVRNLRTGHVSINQTAACDNSFDNVRPAGGGSRSPVVGQRKGMRQPRRQRPSETTKPAGQGSDLRVCGGQEWGSNRRPSDFQAERARPERSSRAESVFRRRDFVPYRSVIRELVLANPLANRSPGGCFAPASRSPSPTFPQQPHSSSTQADPLSGPRRSTNTTGSADERAVMFGACVAS